MLPENVATQGHDGAIGLCPIKIWLRWMAKSETCFLLAKTDVFQAIQAYNG
jgi:hypothetical protein